LFGIASPSAGLAQISDRVTIFAKRESRLINVPENNDYSLITGLHVDNQSQSFSDLELTLIGFERNEHLLSSHFELVLKGLGLHFPETSFGSLLGAQLPMRKYVRNELNTAFNRWIIGGYLAYFSPGLRTELSYRTYESQTKRSAKIDDFSISFQAQPYYESRLTISYQVMSFLIDYRASYYTGLQGLYDVIFISDAQSHSPVFAQNLQLGFQLKNNSAFLLNLSRSTAKGFQHEKLLRLMGLNIFPSGMNAYGIALRFYH
jgi:hypothetical protein